MPMQKTMTQDEVKKLLARGDVSQGRYGKRDIKGKMNKTEEAYAEILETKKLIGEIVEWYFHAITLAYGEDARFTTDFFVMYPDGLLEFVDVKGAGPVNEASICRAKACAEKFWMFTFVVEKSTGVGKNRTWQRIVL